MQYIAAVDGGGSSTACCIVNSAGEVLAQSTGAGILPISAPGGVERCRAVVLQVIEEACAKAGLHPTDIAIASLGMTGLLPLMERTVNEALHFIPDIVLVHDSVTAHEGALLGQPGTIVISGTGSIALTRNVQGQSATAGGWGPLMGDEGSGYWIGLQALSLATRAADGRLGKTDLMTSVPAGLGVANLQEVHALLYSLENPRPKIASLTRAVALSAAAGDATAISLLKTAGRHLGDAAVAAYQGVSEGPTLFSYTGGVFRSGEPLLQAFAERILEVAPNAEVVPPALTGVGGAIVLGLKRAGTALDQTVVERLRAALAHGK